MMPHLVRVLFILAFAAAAGCGSSPKPPPAFPTDVELANAIAAGRLAYERGALDLAEEQYRRALSRARAADDAVVIADQAHNLAVTCLTVGRLSAALDAIDEAEVAARRADLPLADILLLRARVAYAQASQGEAAASSLDRAESHAARAIDDPKSRPTDVHRVAVAVLMTEIASDRGDLPAATKHLDAALALAGKMPSAGVSRAKARVARLKRNDAAAAAAFDDEARLHQQSHRYVEMARALENAGRAYALAGDHAAAADRLYRAAASLQGQGRAAAAALEAARQSAEKAGDSMRLKLINNLQQEMSPTTRPRD